MRSSIEWAFRCVCTATVWFLGFSIAHAQTGVSSDRVSLPEGPGSLEGVGENVDVDPNMALMRWSVPFIVPQGFAGATPALGLQYSSGRGSSVVGMGWELGLPFIERMTRRGLPKYDRTDEFAVNGSEELVRVVDSDRPSYRARYEKGFVRYRWRDAGEGTDGYWTAEYPDGGVAFFGADADGKLVAEARFQGDGGVFRYHLVETIDVFRHRVRYRYSPARHSDRTASIPLLDRVEYVFDAAGKAQYRVQFEYEARSDADAQELLSDCRSGVNELLAKRLAKVEVFSRGRSIRRYELSYEPYADSGGFTRLVRVERFGAEGGRHPIAFSFQYSKALGGLCREAACGRPFLTAMGTLPGGVNVQAGNATLIDINGDALPDVLDTSLDGAHRFYTNILQADGAHRFEGPVDSTIGTSGGQRLRSAYVQVMDSNGDGFTDILNAQTGQVLINRGLGDWMGSVSLGDVSSNLPNLGEDLDLGDGEPVRVRFFDYDNDKHIDVIRSLRTSTTIYRNLPKGGFASDSAVENIGWGFDEDGLQLTDMNGDGLLDAVVLRRDEISYRLNLGWGRWTPPQTVSTDLGLSDNDLALAELEDLNGDGLSDLVIVAGDTVRYALSRNGERFLSLQPLKSSDVDGELPTRDEAMAVLFADMNGNGSTDVVWISNSGAVSYLELFPVRPNLLSRVENGIGMVTDVHYGTSVEHMARDREAGKAWSNPLPHPMIVVDQVDTWDGLTNVHEITNFRYRDGFYDGIEKHFRGYAQVEAELVGDESIEAGLTKSRYDVGVSDSYRNGLVLETSISSAGRAIRSESHKYDDCPVSEVPGEGLRYPVRHVCEVATQTVHQEGAPRSEWKTVASRYEHDGYGNVTLDAQLGVTKVGSGGCEACARPDELFGAPCGEMCLGDELYTETEYVTPNNAGRRWLINAPYEVREYGRAGDADSSERKTYYDGEAFVGLPLGQLNLGLASRITDRVASGSDETIAAVRNRFDEHGNVIESLDPLGSSGSDGHRNTYVMSADGLRVERVEVHVGNGRRLRRDVRYEPLFDLASEGTAWQLVEGSQTVTDPNASFFSYDEYGRIVALARPGDTLDAPTQVFAYELADPVSRTVARGRSERGGALDLETAVCADGRGRTVQGRTRLGAESYQANGFVVRNVGGGERRVYQPYLGSSGSCDLSPPSDVASVRTLFDATGRVLGEELPDAELYGSASTHETRYLPLRIEAYDPEDTDSSSAHANTPLVSELDGLGREGRIERRLGSGEPGAVTELRYDGLGRLHGYVDAAGHTKTQAYDLLGRLLSVKDPNAGETRFKYDDAGNVTERRDARGVTARMDYDGANRLVRQWDAADPDKTQRTLAYDASDRCGACANGAGLVVVATYPVGEDRTGYDARGRPVHAARTLGGIEFAFARVYDNADRLVSATYPDGRTLERSYDAASRPITIAGLVDGVDYDARGLLAGTTCANGTKETRTYDSRMRLATLSTRGRDDTLLLDFAYTHDRADSILSIGDKAAVDGRLSAAANYTYDAWYRVTEARLEPGGAAEEVLSYAYDAVDNLTSRTSSLGAASRAHVGTYAYGDKAGPNAVTRAGERARAYDRAGHMIERGTDTLLWDFAGRLTEVERDGAALASHDYGAGPDRVRSQSGDHTTLYLAPDYEVRDGVAVLYPRFGRARIARQESTALSTRLLSDVGPLKESGSVLQSAADGEINAADAWVAHASGEDLLDWEGEASNPAQLMAAAVRRLLSESAGALSYLHADHLGSLVLATDEQGAATARRHYSPLGTLRAAEDDGVAPYGYTGQEHDASSGLVHFRFRYLDSAVGRWVSADPLFAEVTPGSIGALGESTTAYAYVANNPTGSIDPTGLGRGQGQEGGGRKSAGAKKRVDVKRQGRGSKTGHRRNAQQRGVKSSRGRNLGARRQGGGERAAKALGIRSVEGNLRPRQLPSDVRFSQNNVGATSGDGHSVRGTAQQLANGTLSPAALPPINLVQDRQGRLFSLDNRRLTSFRMANRIRAQRGDFRRLRIRVMKAPRRSIKGQLRKFTTTNDGASIDIRGGGGTVQ